MSTRPSQSLKPDVQALITQTPAMHPASMTAVSAVQSVHALPQLSGLLSEHRSMSPTASASPDVSIVETVLSPSV